MKVDQTDFTTAMLDPARGVPDGLIDPQGRSAGKRFNVYRNNVAVSLTEALITAFPSLCRMLGDEHFRTLASVYLRRHPPKSPLMMFYGEDMPDFLTDFEPLAGLEYLPGLSRVDLARRHSYHAADSTPVNPQALQDMPPGALMQSRLRIAPSARVLASRWPIFSLWRRAMEGGAEPPEMQPEEVLIARPEFDPLVMRLPEGGAAFIEALQSGRNFSASVDAATGVSANFDLAATLGAMLSVGAITKITEGDDGG